MIWVGLIIGLVIGYVARGFESVVDIVDAAVDRIQNTYRNFRDRY